MVNSFNLDCMYLRGKFVRVLLKWSEICELSVFVSVCKLKFVSNYSVNTSICGVENSLQYS